MTDYISEESESIVGTQVWRISRDVTLPHVTSHPFSWRNKLDCDVTPAEADRLLTLSATQHYKYSM